MDLINTYLTYLKNNKRYSQHTLKAYEVDLLQFDGFLQKETAHQNILKVNNKDIRNWIVQLVESKTTPRSVNRKITSLRSFYKFHLLQGALTANPASSINPLKTEKKLPVFVKQDQINFLFDDFSFGNGYEEVRNKTILELFYNTGMRLSELVQIMDNDCDFYNNSIKVTGKRNKQRVVPLSSVFANKLKEYMAYKNTCYTSNNLFVTLKGDPVYAKLVYRLVNKYLSFVSTQKKKSPHVIRHTFATHMLNNGADINAIKEILGHANLAATEIYTHISFERLKFIYKHAHPRAKITEDLQ